MSLSPNQTLPADGLNKPTKVPKRVVLPAPLEPIKATISFFSTSNEISQRTCNLHASHLHS